MLHDLPLLLGIFIAGFVGSWHCAMMCGPICLGLSREQSIWSYHAGRGVSYTLIGAGAGELGQRLLWHNQPTVKILSFLFLFSSLILMSFAKKSKMEKLVPKKLIRYIFSQRGHPLFFVGCLSVFLPCSWLYSFVISAASTQNPWTGSLVMFLFWLSTLPALAGSSLITRQVIHRAPADKRNWALLWLSLAGSYSLIAHYLLH